MKNMKKKIEAACERKIQVEKYLADAKANLDTCTDSFSENAVKMQITMLTVELNRLNTIINKEA